VRLLDDLPGLDDEGGWYRQTALARLQDVHYQVLAVLIDLITSDGDTDVEQGWLDKFGDQLTPEEALLLRRAGARPRRVESLLRWWQLESNNLVEAVDGGSDIGEDDTEPAPPTHPLLKLADAYHATIVGLTKRAASSEENGDVGSDSSHDGSAQK
jgi:hypothetical protein